MSLFPPFLDDCTDIAQAYSSDLPLHRGYFTELEGYAFIFQHHIIFLHQWARLTLHCPTPLSLLETQKASWATQKAKVFSGGPVIIVHEKP